MLTAKETFNRPDVALEANKTLTKLAHSTEIRLQGFASALCKLAITEYNCRPERWLDALEAKEYFHSKDELSTYAEAVFQNKNSVVKFTAVITSAGTSFSIVLINAGSTIYIR